MQDWRALANLANLRSYREWEREGYRRSGFYAFVIVNTSLAPLLTLCLILGVHTIRFDRGLSALAAAAFILYVVASLGLGFLAAIRLRSWRRAHPWAPPSPSASGVLRS